jgi:hypothetical protein
VIVLVAAGEGRRHVIRAVEDGGACDAVPIGVHLDSVDPLDVGRATPARHQGWAVRAAVFVAPHDRVLEQPGPGAVRGCRLVPGDERRVGARVLERTGVARAGSLGIRDRNAAPIEDRCVPQREVARVRRRHDLDGQVAEPHVVRPRGRAVVGEAQLERVPPRRHRAERQLPLARRRRQHDEVARVGAVEGDRDDRRLGACSRPVGVGLGAHLEQRLTRRLGGDSELHRPLAALEHDRAGDGPSGRCLAGEGERRRESGGQDPGHRAHRTLPSLRGTRTTVSCADEPTRGWHRGELPERRS